MATETIDREELINEIWKHKGKISLVARKLGCSVRTIYYYAEKYATVQNAVDAARQDFDEILLDNAEVGLQKQVVEQRAWAIRYVLDKKGHDRGYVDRKEITGKDGGAVDINAVLSKAIEKAYADQD